MQVINLVSWAGDEFSYKRGDVIDLPDDTALARIALDLCAPLAPVETQPAKPKTRRGRPRKNAGTETASLEIPEVR